MFPPILDKRALTPGFVLGMWHWSQTVFRPAQALKRAGLYRPLTLGTLPAAPTPIGHGPDLSLRQRTPLFLDDEPENYGCVREFDHYAPGYERMVQPFTGPILEESLAFMRPYVAPNARILDPSAGPGRNAIRIAREMVPAGEVIAADLSRGMVEAASRNAMAEGARNMAFIQADASDPSAELAGYFDAIFCCMSFHHYPNEAPFANAFRRVLRPGGACFVVDAGTEWFIRLTEPISVIVDPGFARHRSGAQFIQIFNRAGFSNVYWTEILPGIGVTLAIA